MSRAPRANAGGNRRSGDSGKLLSKEAAGNYLHRSQLPLTSLLFLLPLVIFYEAGTYYFAYDAAHHTEQRIVAFTLLQHFFHLFGASGRYLPALAVCVILLAWHIARKDHWKLDFNSAGCMCIESVLLSLPLFLLNSLSVRYIPLLTGQGHWPAMCVLSVGAGIYEELMFRLMGITLLSILLMDIMRIRKGWAIVAIVLITSVAFADYHYWWGSEPFRLRTFVFRTAAGIYFGVLFFTRGFGITCGSHAAYDLLAVTLTAWGAH